MSRYKAENWKAISLLTLTVLCLVGLGCARQRVSPVRTDEKDEKKVSQAQAPVIVITKPFGAHEQQPESTVTFAGVPILTLKDTGDYGSAFQRAQVVAKRLNAAVRLAPRKGSDLTILGYHERPTLVLGNDTGSDPRIFMLKVYDEDAASYSERSEIGVTVQLLSKYWLGMISILLNTDDADAEAGRVGQSALPAFRALREQVAALATSRDVREGMPEKLREKLQKLSRAVPEDVPTHGKVPGQP